MLKQVKKIENFQIKKMFAIASKLKMDKEDLYALAGVGSLHDLTYLEANEVVDRLSSFLADKEKVPDMMTDGQKKKAWRLMYELESLDLEKSKVTVGKRLVGIINKELKMTVSHEEPFRWINYEKGNKLIEALKRYVKYAKNKKG